MSQKIYYDATNNKEVVDVSGTRDEAAVKAEFGLTNAVQIVVIDESFEATEVLAGVLTKFDHKQRGIDQAAAAKATADGKQTSALAKLNAGRTGADITVEDLEDLGV